MYQIIVRYLHNTACTFNPLHLQWTLTSNYKLYEAIIVLLTLGRHNSLNLLSLSYYVNFDWVMDNLPIPIYFIEYLAINML